MKADASGWALFGISAAAVVVGWLWILLGCLLFIVEWRSLRFQGAGVLVGKQRKWYADRVSYTTTIGRGIWMARDYYDDTTALDNWIELHEFVHIKQWEDAQAWGLVGGALAAVLGAAWLHLSAGQFFGMWAIIYVLSVASLVTNFATAIMRYGWNGIYLDTEHERSAYAQTDPRPGGGTWEQARDKERLVQRGLLG